MAPCLLGSVSGWDPGFGGCLASKLPCHKDTLIFPLDGASELAGAVTPSAR